MAEKSASYVEVDQPKGEMRRIPLNKAHVQVGRTPTCDIWLSDLSVSRRHARIESPTPGMWRVVDLGSRNGTFVNENAVQLHNLAEGDVLRFGNCRMVFRMRERMPDKGAVLEPESPKRDTISRIVDMDSLHPQDVLKVETLAELHNIMRRFNRTASVQALLGMLAEEFRSVLKPDRLAISVERSGKHTWPVVLDANGRPTSGADLSRRLAGRTGPITDTMGAGWETSENVLSESQEETRGCLVFPVKAGSKVMGYVYAERFSKAWEPHRSDVQFLAVLTRQAALLLENMQLVEESKAGRQVIEELNAARRIQIEQFPTALDLDPRADIAARNHPAFAISGDYYDCQLVAPGEIAFIIADVMGHGIPAAILMTRLHVVFRLAAKSGYELGRLDAQLCQVMQTVSGGHVFATGIIGVCDLERNSLRMICAGHPWPSLIAAAGHVEAMEACCTFPWGVMPEERRTEPPEIRLGDRWSLLAFTDGLTEIASFSGEPYSNRRVREFHGRNTDMRADDLCEGICDQVLSHADPSAPPRDDMTILAIRRKERKDE